ncbi:MAG TPA: hypothetical protein VGL56_20185 [Fimbriimonadaceae bacterium]|jgi:hypothetical protein
MGWFPWFNNDRPLVDKGFELSWYRLSHRRRFWRIVWFTPIYFFLLTLPNPTNSHTHQPAIYKVVMLAIVLGTGVYEYWAWQTGK